MAVLVIVFRKMLKNRWLVLSLLAGLVISVALVSSIPLYSSGVLQRVLIGDLEKIQADSGKVPGSANVSLYFKSATPEDQRIQVYREIDDYVRNDLFRHMGLEYNLMVRIMETDASGFTYLNTDRPNGSGNVRLQSISGLFEHIEITQGRLPNPGITADGFMEAIVLSSAYEKLNVLVDDTAVLKVPYVTKGFQEVKVRIVGEFKRMDTGDGFWSQPSLFGERFFIHEEDFENNLMDPQKPLLKNVAWFTDLDYRNLMVHQIGTTMTSYGDEIRYFESHYPNEGVTVDIPMTSVIEGYVKQFNQVNLLLLSLNVPVLILLCFYIFMVSYLIVDADRNEIALLRSRGASRMSIVGQYLLEGVLLGAVALIVSPPLGLMITRILGASSGFLEFVNRKALPLTMSADAYKYAVVAVLAFMVMLLLPAYQASAATIVGHKQQTARKVKRSWWKMFCVDFILMAIAGYGYYTYYQQQKIMLATNIGLDEMQISPIIFFASTLFALGAGLFFLRLFPVIVESVYRIGRRFWKAPMYQTLTHVGRSSTQYQFLMLFLMLTIAIGLFSASAARTLSSNAEQRIRYQYGADMIMKVVFPSDSVSVSSTVQDPLGGMETATSFSVTRYHEPAFRGLESVEGIQSVTRVYRTYEKSIKFMSTTKDRVEIMGIDPEEFGKTVWFSNNLMSHHINEYLNLIVNTQPAVLVSRSLEEDMKLRVGDYISINWAGRDVEAIVYGFIDYWPGWNPVAKYPTIEELLDPEVAAKYTPSNARTAAKPYFVVANLSYMIDQSTLEPYEIWCNLDDNVPIKTIYDGIGNLENLNVRLLGDARQEVVKVRNNPIQLGVNGTMTLGFVVSLVVSFMGFLLYWILSMRGRIFEFGVLRAMGITKGQLVQMLVVEQLLTSGVSIVAGLFIGAFTSRLFVPMLQITSQAQTNVPPFQVVSLMDDRMKLYVMLGLMLIIGLSVLVNQLMRIKISQAIKLGED